MPEHVLICFVLLTYLGRERTSEIKTKSQIGKHKLLFNYYYSVFYVTLYLM